MKPSRRLHNAVMLDDATHAKLRYLAEEEGCTMFGMVKVALKAFETWREFEVEAVQRHHHRANQHVSHR